MIKVIVIDDSTMFTSFMKSISKGSGEVDIIAECSTGIEGIQQTQRLKPDAILLDVHLPGLSGITIAKKILQNNPKAKILIASISSSPIYIYNLAKIGVKGYITKGETDANEVLTILKHIVNGEECFSEDAANAMAFIIKQNPTNFPLLQLSPQEIEVAAQLIGDRSIREIADALFLSDKRIYRLRHEIFSKLQVVDKDQLCARYWKYFYNS